jgi:hypothetical protein
VTYPPPAPPYVGPPYRKSPGDNKPIRRIVLHGTVSPTERGGARNIARYFRSSAAGGSAHYCVDPGEVVQTAYDSVIAWHAPPNGNSIGIELCDMVGDKHGKPLPLSRWNEANHAAMLQLAARLTAELCLAYDVPVRMVGPVGLKAGKQGICEHSDVSQAFKQSSHWDLGMFPRRRFIRMVRAERDQIIAANDDSAAPAKPTGPTRVTKARDLLEQAYRRAKHPRRRTKLRGALDTLPRR